MQSIGMWFYYQKKKKEWKKNIKKKLQKGIENEGISNSEKQKNQQDCKGKWSNKLQEKMKIFERKPN